MNRQVTEALLDDILSDAKHRILLLLEKELEKEREAAARQKWEAAARQKWEAARATRSMLTLQEAADQFGVSKRTIQNWVSKEMLPVTRIRRVVRVNQKDLDDLLNGEKATR